MNGYAGRESSVDARALFVASARRRAAALPEAQKIALLAGDIARALRAEGSWSAEYGLRLGLPREDITRLAHAARQRAAAM